MLTDNAMTVKGRKRKVLVSSLFYTHLPPEVIQPINTRVCQDLLLSYSGQPW